MKSKSVLVKSESEITSGKQGIPRSRNLISGLRSLKLVWAVQAYVLAPSQRLNCLMQLAQPMSQASGISPGCTLPLTKGLRSDSAKDTMNPFLTRPQSPRTAGRLKINSSIRIILLHCTSVFLVLFSIKTISNQYIHVIYFYLAETKCFQILSASDLTCSASGTICHFNEKEKKVNAFAERFLRECKTFKSTNAAFSSN